MKPVRIFVFFLLLAAPLRAQLIISEFLAGNGTSIRDENYDHEDWIEIFNGGPGTANLQGWYLSDDSSQLRKWAFPAWTLNSGSYLVVFASNKNRTPAQAVAGQDNPGTVTQPRLHTNFKLSPSAGGYLALVHEIASGGAQVIQEFNPYPQQITDVSYGTTVTTTTTPLLATGASAKSFVPTPANGGNTLPYSAWTGAAATEPFNDSAWTVGSTGVGFPSAGIAGDNLKLRLNANTSATLVDDTSGGTHNGASNVATWIAETPDANGRTRHGALQFNATDSNGGATGDQVVIPAHADFNVTSGTIMFWIKTAGNVADGGNVEGSMLFDRRVGTGVGQGLVMYLRDAGNMQIQPGPTQVNTFQSTGTMKDDRWHHLALVFNTASGQPCTFYIDGTISGTRNNTGPWSFNAAQQIEIGRSHDTYWRRFNGLLDDYRFYNTPLTPAQIQTIYNEEDEPITPGTDLQAAMQNVNPSAFIRIPFSVADPAAFTGISLTTRWNDGYTAWLNGTQVASFAAPATLAWDSAATQSHSAGAPFASNLSVSLLRPGTNILALQGLNNTSANGAFFVLPQLDGTNTTIGAAGYLASSTPGAQNGAPQTAIGPFVSNVTQNPAPRPLGTPDSPPLTITAKVVPTLRALAAASPVQLKYRVMYGVEQSVDMTLTAVPDVYSASIPTAAPALGPGQMLRWRVVASDNTAVVGTAPEYRTPLDNDQYYGTVAVDSTIETSLPVLYWFSTTATAADSATARCSFFFKAPNDPGVGRFYDNVEVYLHGQSTRGFPRKSYNLDLNADNRFEWNATAQREKDIKLLSNWGDKSKTRNTLSHETFAAIGSAAHWCFPVRIQQVTTANAATPAAHYYAIYDMMEDGDDHWLNRLGLDPEGALYKSYNDLSSSGSLEKKTRKQEGKADADALIAGLNPGTALATRRAYGYANLDLPQCVSYFVGCVLTAHQDHGHKNYYIYRDTNGTREWGIFPWDIDLTWGRTWTDAGGYLTDTITTTHPLNCYPGYNDGGSVGSVQNKGTMNRLYSLMFDSPEFRRMYLRRLRSEMDNYLGTGPGVIDARVDFLTESMDPSAVGTSDADRDRTKWGTWGNDGGNTAGGAVVRYHTGILKDTFLVGRRSFLNSANAKLYYTPGNPNTAPNNFETIPPSQPANAADLMSIETVDANPTTGTQDHEYFVIRNANTDSVDISGWQITGAVELTFKPGTVLLPGAGATDHIGDLFVARNPYAFRQGANVAGGRTFCFVQGPYKGQLSARGETIELRNAAGVLLKSKTSTPAPTEMQNFLRITELNYAPVPPSAAESAALPGVIASDFEFIELMNTGTSPLTLTGAHFDEGIGFTFPNFTLAAGARCLLVGNLGAFQLRYGHGSDGQIVGAFTDNLDNNGESIHLLDNVGESILDFRYETWFPQSDEGGRSLVIRSANPDWQAYSEPTSWAMSGNANGSPGAADSDFATAYEAWRYEHFTVAEFPTPQTPNAPAAVEVDAEGDGLSNLAEYAFGRNPRTHDNSALTVASVVSVGGTDYSAITFTRRHKALDLTWTIEASSDLLTWEAIDLPIGTPESLGGGLERVTYRDSQPTSVGQRFLRVRAVK